MSNKEDVNANHLKVNVLEIIMNADAVNDKEIGNDISNLIQLIDSKGLLLQHSEGTANVIDATLDTSSMLDADGDPTDEIGMERS